MKTESACYPPIKDMVAMLRISLFFSIKRMIAHDPGLLYDAGNRACLVYCYL
ncbi:MAG: hypothetical protein ABSB95_00210 [Dissulfurispiraceae bacterium]|jgi:hypothetical protein